jgi:dinuclear metal center YbgI/SA1388 family protein
MKVKELVRHLESIAPPSYQEGYDNAGLITGDYNWEISGVITCLDSTEAVIEEAIAKGCNVVVAHHPIVFKGLKRFNGNNYVERVVIKAIQHNIAIYAIHTNLDNVYHNGVNAKIAEKLQLEGTKILAPKKAVLKLVAYVPAGESDAVRNALFEAGAGRLHPNANLSFSSIGVGTINEQSEALVKIEVTLPNAKKGAVLSALFKAYGPASANYEISSIDIADAAIGSGMIGQLAKPMKGEAFLKYLKKQMNVGCIKHTALLDKEIKKVAVCGGAGGFLLRTAISKGADVFVTSDYKYHEFFDADSKIIIADIGHYESEQFTIELLFELISEKFSNFAVHCTEVITNPVHYF